MKRIFILIRLFVFLFILNTAVFAQEPYFKQIPVTGASSNIRINAICQGNHKLIWIGTSEGIYRYDGFNFQKQELPPSLKGEAVSSIVAQSGNGIIAGTKSGKLFSISQNKVSLLNTAGFTTESAISGICLLPDSEIWVSTLGDGLYRLFRGKWEHYNKLNGISDDYIYSIICDSLGKIWTGSDRGLSMSVIRFGKTFFRNFDTKDGLPDNIIRQLIVGPGNTIGIGMEEKGFCVFNPALATFTYPEEFKKWNYGAVTSLMVLENEFWIGTARSGIIDYEFKAYKRIRQFSKNEGFNASNLNSMLKDHEGNVWIAASNELYFSSGEHIEFKNSLDGVPLKNIRTILCDQMDNLLFSTDSGIYYYNKLKSPGQRLTQPLKGTKFEKLGVISLYEDIYGFIWMGTFDHGVLRFKPATGEMKIFSESDGLVNSNVLSVDGDGSTIWFATLGGVSRCFLLDSTINGVTSFQGYSQENGLGNNFIYKVFIDHKKRVWFATDGKGVTCFENGEFINYNEKKGLKSKVIYSITEDPFGNIWLSSSVDGVFRFDGKSFRNFSIAQGLSNLNITAITADENGNILVINNKGIDVIDSRNFQVITFGEELGVSDIDPDVNATTTDRLGNVWIGTQKGIIKMALEQQVGDKQPVLLLNEVLCMLEPVDTVSVKKFPYDLNHISFDYTAIWYTDPQKVTYQYKLDGYNNEWITTRDRFINFPNLRPGNYKFNLRASINGNFSNSTIISYSFRINFPLWEQTWFIVLMTICIVVLIYFYLSYRDRRAKSIELIKKEKIESQFEILKNQVNPHFLFNSFNTLITVIENDKDVAIEYVNKLSDFFRSILTYREKDLISFSEELELVENYVFLQQKRYGTNFTVTIDWPASARDEYLIPPLTLQILLENCLKHNSVSKETPLFVNIFNEDNKFLVIKNNINPKMVKDPSTGIGLHNLKNRYLLIAKTDIILENNSITFTVKLPLIKK